MPEHPEIKALQAIVEALDEIDTEARARVIAWVAHKYGIATSTRKPTWPTASGHEQEGDTETHFDAFSGLFDAASPQTEAQMALVGGYWFQAAQGQTDFSAQQVNDELKNLGHRLTNVTRAFDFLRQTKPALVLQIQKSGRTKQARKRYRLTQAGIKAVGELIKGREA